MISVEHLTKKYGQFLAVDDINFTVNQGEIAGFLGPNGAGKSTTFKMLCGYLEPTSGQALIEGFNVQEQSLETRKRIGYLQEAPTLYKEMKIPAYLSFVAALKGVSHSQKKNRVNQVIEQCGLQAVVKKAIGAVSKGYRQRVALAQALVGNPPVLFLDEPSSGLDPIQAVEIRNLISSLAKERTILFSTHILSEAAACCERVIIISKGKIMADGPVGHLQEALQKTPIIILRFTVLSPAIIKDLEKMDQVQEVKKADETTVEIRSANAGSVRNQIYQKTVEHRWPLEEMYLKKEDLEKIFLQLAGN